MSTVEVDSVTTSHISKQQRFFNEANSLIIPAATEDDITEVVSTSGYFLSDFTYDWKTNDISWLCDVLSSPPKNFQQCTVNDWLNHCKSIGIYNLEIATLLCSISEVSGTPSSLVNRTNNTSNIIAGENFATVSELYKMEYGPDANVPEGYKFNPRESNRNISAANLAPEVELGADGYLNSSPSLGVCASDKSKIKPNYSTTLAGRGKIELPVFYTWEFDPCVAEAISNIEGNIAPPKPTNSGQAAAVGSDDEDEDEEEEAPARGNNRGNNRSKQKPLVNKYAKILFPWYFKSRINISSKHDRFVYPNLDRKMFSKLLHPAAIYDQDEKYTSFMEQPIDVSPELGFQANSLASFQARHQNTNQNVDNVKFGNLGFPLIPTLKLPKVVPYLIYIPTTGDSYHMIVAVKIVDPHFDGNALSKRIQQKMHRTKKGSVNSEWGNREIGQMNIPHLNDGFHNENLQFNKEGNPSLADDSHRYFQFLCDYYALSSQRDMMLDDEIEKYRLEAGSMAMDSNYDEYATIDHPLNMNTLFTWERAMTFFKNISGGEEENNTISQMNEMVTMRRLSDVLNPSTMCPSTLDISYDISIKPFLSLEPTNIPCDKQHRFRCYRYPAKKFRWCYHNPRGGIKTIAGLAIEMKPHIHPVFQLEDATYTAIINSQNKPRNLHIENVVNGKIDHMQIDQDPPETLMSAQSLNIFRLFNSFSHRTHSSRNEPKVLKAPRWKHLLDEEDGDICQHTNIKTLPNSKLPAGYDSYFVFLLLIENRIMGPLDKIRPTIVLGMPCINYLIDTMTFGLKHPDSQSEKYFKEKILDFVEKQNEFFDHLEIHRKRIIKFTNNYFFNPQIVKRVGKVMTEGWLSMIQHYGELLKTSVGFFGNPNINVDKLRPCYYQTMADGMTMMTASDSVMGAWCEQQARRVHEQADLYQNNSLFFVAMFGCVMCVYRMDGVDKLNLLFIGEFAAGKSHLITMIIRYCIDGFVYSLHGASPQAFVGTGLQADKMLSASEGFSLMETHPDLMKGAITDSNVNKTVCSHDSKSGVRIKIDYYGGFYLSIMMGANKQTPDAALRSRFYCPIALRDNRIVNETCKKEKEMVRKRQKDQVFTTTAGETYKEMFNLETYVKKLTLPESPPPRIPLKPRGFRAAIQVPDQVPHTIPIPMHPPVVIEDAPEEETLIIPPNPVTKETEYKGDVLVYKTNTVEDAKMQGKIEMEEYWKQSQVILFFIQKYQASKAIPRVCMDFWDNIQSSIKERIEKHFPYIFTNNPRILGRIKTIILGVCEADAIRRVFFDPTGVYYKIPFKQEYALAVAPYLSVTWDHICMGVSIANDEILDNVKGKIILAFLKVSGFYNYCEKFREYAVGIKSAAEEDCDFVSPEQLAISRVLSTYKNGIKIDRTFCSATDFHKVKWLHTHKDKSSMAYVANYSTRTHIPHSVPNKEAEYIDDTVDIPAKTVEPKVATAFQRPRTIVTESSGNKTNRPKPTSTVRSIDEDRVPNLIYDSRLESQIEEGECIDLNKLVINAPNLKMSTVGPGSGTHGIPKIFADVLKRELKKKDGPVISDAVFNAEIANMTNIPIKANECRFKPISYKEYLRAVNSTEEGIIVPIETKDNGDDNAIQIGTDGNLLAFEPSLANTKGSLNIILDVQALRYLDGYLILTNILLELSKELPLRKMRVPLMFHGPGARLSYIQVGSTKYGKIPQKGQVETEKNKNVRFQSTKLDSYRSVMDYNLDHEGYNSEDDLYDNDDAEIELTPIVDLNDYYRLKHILSSNIMRFNVTAAGKFEFEVVDFSKPENSPNRSTYKDMTYFFESTRKEQLFKYYAPLRNNIKKMAGKREREEDQPLSRKKKN